MQLITPYSEEDRATPSVFTSVTHCSREKGGTSVESTLSDSLPRVSALASSGLRMDVSRSFSTELSSICEPMGVMCELSSARLWMNDFLLSIM